MSSFEVLEIPADQGGPRLAQFFNAQRDETQLTALRRGGTVLMAVLPAPLAGSLVLRGAALLETARIVAGVWICVALGSLFLVAAELRSRRRVASLLRQLGATRSSSRASPP
jgi:hypothetical protein